MPGVRAFYAARSYRPAWIDNPGSRNAGIALDILRNADQDGLQPDSYHLTELGLRGHPTTARASAEFDILLTDAVLHYARDQREGRAELRILDRDVELPRDRSDIAGGLNSALGTGHLTGFLDAVAPPHLQYSRLKSALAHYRDLAVKGGWPTLYRGPAGFENETGRAELRARLAYDDPDVAAGGDLQAAVERFQRRHGLDADGRVGPSTLRELNVTAAERAAQIEANMERWRWVPRSFGPRYVVVNAADATLEVIKDGRTVLQSRVITGKPTSPSAIFGATITDVTINPYWNIPSPILRNEILPKERRHPGYLARSHIVLDASGRYRQMPGADNALGRLKIEMANPFDIYLHDTPSRSLFAASDRHLSHGCIRVEQIRPLASFVLTGDPAKGLPEIDAAIASGDNRHIPAGEPLPVYVLYWTAMANGDGTVDFRPDVYGRDQRLLAALAGQRPVGRVTLNASECSAPRA
jgi:murein L,D-transpeptidase YcbB/YkuD